MLSTSKNMKKKSDIVHTLNVQAPENFIDATFQLVKTNFI